MANTPLTAASVREQARANGRVLRSLLLAQERWLTSEQVAALMQIDVNPDAHTSNLRSRGMLMGAQYQGQYFHPAVQFGTASAPLPRLQELLTLLPKSGNCWGAMFWLFQPNTLLDGLRPADVLPTDVPAVIAVAFSEFVQASYNW